MSDPAMFVAVCDAEGAIVFDFPAQQKAYCKRKLAGTCVDVLIAPQGLMKTKRQSDGFHAMIQPWAKDEGHEIDYLKFVLLRQIFGTKEQTNPITGEIELVLREPHMSTLSRAKYSELIDRTLEIAAECGYILVAPDEYRRNKQKAQRKAERQSKRELVGA